MSHRDFTIYPAIDVRDGHVVRLRQGDYAQETRYADDPHAVAQTYAAAGAGWLHLVDLDAARSGGYTLDSILLQIKATTPLRIQTGGGVRSERDVQRLLDAGADRVVVGSLAVRESDRVGRWIAEFGEDRIVVALDTRLNSDGRWQLPVHGWTQVDSHESAIELDDLLQHYVSCGLVHLLCTDIARDGMLAGPNFDLYDRIRAVAPSLAIQASGGVRDSRDVDEARVAGCAGVVLGRALLEGSLQLSEVLEC